jgi:hypothetical protein
VIAFIVHDSDMFLYWFCEEGKELDRSNSAPGYFTEQEAPPEGGNPETLMVYGQPGTSTDRLLRLLHKKENAPEPPAPRKYDRDAVNAKSCVSPIRRLPRRCESAEPGGVSCGSRKADGQPVRP